MKKYLFDIPHPHFVHFFKNVINKLGKENVVVTCQDSGIIINLLQENGIEYIKIGKKYKSLFGKGIGQLLYFIKYIKLIRTNNVNIVIGMSPAILFAARILRKKMFFFDDDDSAVQPLTKKITIPLSNVIITPKCLEFENYGSKHIVYKGYQELAYLSPGYFQPDIEIVHKYKLSPNGYSIVRFNDFVAHHDVGHQGIPHNTKTELIKTLSQFGDVFITSESPLSKEFSKYQLKVQPSDIHHILAFAKIYVGDSQTMASEAAVLGTPSIRCNSFKGKISYLNELEDIYNLTFAYFPNEGDIMLKKVYELLQNPDTPQVWIEKQKKMLQDMEDVNDFIINELSK